ncbi:hypothetical protein Cs7R123_08330 [Catellatospora sp. TT07R-123]|nr:hypothetical protein Cs7R123_08330 [Catellatospora sp. TT07R-123]
MNSGCTDLELISQALTTRAISRSCVMSILNVTNAGLKTPAANSRATSAAITSSRPGVPGDASGSTSSQGVRSTPNSSSVPRSPRRRVNLGISRAPAIPPRQGRPNARPYCHGFRSRSRSMNTAIRGVHHMTAPPKSIAFQNSGRSCAWDRM